MYCDYFYSFYAYCDRQFLPFLLLSSYMGMQLTPENHYRSSYCAQSKTQTSHEIGVAKVGFDIFLLRYSLKTTLFEHILNPNEKMSTLVLQPTGECGRRPNLTSWDTMLLYKNTFRGPKLCRPIVP